MMGDLVENEQRPHGFGLRYISINLGYAVGPPVGGPLAGSSYQWLFLADAGTTAAFALIILLLIPETKPAAGTSDVISAVDSRNAPTDTVSLGQAAKHICGDWTFMVLCLATLMSSIVFMQGTTPLPIHIQSAGLDSFDFGLLIGINGAMIFVFQLPMTHALAPFNRMGVIIVGEVLIACGFALTTFADSFGFFALTIVIWTSGEVMNAAFGQTIITDLAPVELRARYMGVFSMTYSVALMIGAPVGGIILERYGAPTLWTAGGFLGVLFVVLHTSIFWSVTQRLTPESDVQNREDTDQTD